MVVGIQSLAIAVLGLALYNDYLHNVYLRIYIDSSVQRYLIAYSAFVGLFSGLILALATTTVLGRGGMASKTKLEEPFSRPGMMAASSQAAIAVDEQRGRPGPLSRSNNVIEQNSRSLISQDRVIVPPSFSESRFPPGRVSRQFPVDWAYFVKF